MIKIDRRAFLGTLGTASAIGAMSHEARAEAVEHYMIEQLNSDAADDTTRSPISSNSTTLSVRGDAARGVSLPTTRV